MAVSLAESNTDRLRKRLTFLSRQLEPLGALVLAGTATAEQERQAARLSLAVSEMESELAEALGDTQVIPAAGLVRWSRAECEYGAE